MIWLAAVAVESLVEALVGLVEQSVESAEVFQRLQPPP